jgi:hypothetical protein
MLAQVDRSQPVGSQGGGGDSQVSYLCKVVQVGQVSGRLAPGRTKIRAAVLRLDLQIDRSVYPPVYR